MSIRVLNGFILLTIFIFSQQVMAAAIRHCSKTQKRCLVQLNEGQNNDRVRVIDDGAHTIDTGKIIMIQRVKNGKGTYAVIELSKTINERREIKRGFPVIVELEHADSHMIWGSGIKSRK